MQASQWSSGLPPSAGEQTVTPPQTPRLARSLCDSSFCRRKRHLKPEDLAESAASVAGADANPERAAGIGGGAAYAAVAALATASSLTDDLEAVAVGGGEFEISVGGYYSSLNYRDHDGSDRGVNPHASFEERDASMPPPELAEENAFARLSGSMPSLHATEGWVGGRPPLRGPLPFSFRRASAPPDERSGGAKCEHDPATRAPPPTSPATHREGSSAATLLDFSSKQRLLLWRSTRVVAAGASQPVSGRRRAPAAETAATGCASSTLPATVTGAADAAGSLAVPIVRRWSMAAAPPPALAGRRWGLQARVQPEAPIHEYASPPPVIAAAAWGSRSLRRIAPAGAVDSLHVPATTDGQRSSNPIAQDVGEARPSDHAVVPLQPGGAIDAPAPSGDLASPPYSEAQTWHARVSRVVSVHHIPRVTAFYGTEQ